MFHVNFVTPQIALRMSLISDVTVVKRLERVVPQRLVQLFQLRILFDVDAWAYIRVLLISECILVQELLQPRELRRHGGP